jgi:hypothetical protein
MGYISQNPPKWVIFNGRSSEEMSVHWTTHHSPTVIAFNWAKHSLAYSKILDDTGVCSF